MFARLKHTPGRAYLQLVCNGVVQCLVVAQLKMQVLEGIAILAAPASTRRVVDKPTCEDPCRALDLLMPADRNLSPSSCFKAHA